MRLATERTYTAFPVLAAQVEQDSTLALGTPEWLEGEPDSTSLDSIVTASGEAAPEDP